MCGSRLLVNGNLRSLSMDGNRRLREGGSGAVKNVHAWTSSNKPRVSVASRALNGGSCRPAVGRVKKSRRDDESKVCSVSSLSVSVCQCRCSWPKVKQGNRRLVCPTTDTRCRVAPAKIHSPFFCPFRPRSFFPPMTFVFTSRPRPPNLDPLLIVPLSIISIVVENSFVS